MKRKKQKPKEGVSRKESLTRPLLASAFSVSCFAPSIPERDKTRKYESPRLRAHQQMKPNRLN